VTLDVEVAGRVYRIEVRRGAAGEQVTVDGRVVVVDLAPTGRSWSMLIGHRSYAVSVEEQSGGTTLVRVNNLAVPVTVTGAGRFGSAASRERLLAGARNGPHRLVAPMPGRIVRVLARTGDTVAAQQALIVIEAMKMENELRAATSGTVTDVRVTEGALVESGAVLAVVE
jgi:biotin carboxyl carrier protein